jgi:hypothetical protein
MNAVDNHVSECREVYAALDRWQRLRLRVWGGLARLTEAKWLEANGWFYMPDGWVPPDWHPRSPRHWIAKGWKPPPRCLYDQNHAANSQRKYWSMPQPARTRRVKRLHTYPAYVRYAPYQLVTIVLSLVLLGVAIAGSAPTNVILLVGLTLVCVSFVIARSQERDLRREYVEELLMRGQVDD